jgi:hypothetical protein
MYAPPRRVSAARMTVGREDTQNAEQPTCQMNL